MLEKMSPEVHEQAIGDRFYSWGWTSGLRRNAQVFAMPAPQLCDLGSIARRRPKDVVGSIVLVTTTHPRYLYRFQSHPVGPQWKEHLEGSLTFADALTRQRRPRQTVSGPAWWGSDQIWRARFPDLTFDDHVPIRRHLRSARLFVIDHPSTTLLEAISVDAPTVLYWDSGRFLLRATAQPYFDSLRTAGVLHDSPHAAAELVNRIAPDPIGWWHTSVVREAVAAFRTHFALTSKAWLRRWEQELRDTSNRGHTREP